MNQLYGWVDLNGFVVNYYEQINKDELISDTNQKITSKRYFKFNTPTRLTIELELNPIDGKDNYMALNTLYNIQEYGYDIESVMKFVIARLSSRMQTYLKYDAKSVIELPSKEWLEERTLYLNSTTEETQGQNEYTWTLNTPEDISSILNKNTNTNINTESKSTIELSNENYSINIDIEFLDIIEEHSIITSRLIHYIRNKL